MTLKLYNTLSGQKEDFEPLDENNIRMYVCGPTVYDRPHVGNARAVVIYDVLFRLLRQEYGENKVNYVRNITDVDDKINAQAKDNNESISDLAKRVEGWFHDDMDALNNLRPNIEPRATEHMEEIISMIENIIKNGHGYESDGHVLFDVGSMAQKSETISQNLEEEKNEIQGGISSLVGDKPLDLLLNSGEFNRSDSNYYYGALSGKILDDLIAGARVDVEDYKRNAGDFVLWKPSNDDEPGWDSPWGIGRPGWHIECSAMSTKYLGNDFDIHGGGADLKFPHHENEIAQSCSANKGSIFAKYWIHNGFLTVGGEKMSKSLGNFTTVQDLLDKGIKGEVIRYVLLNTHYRKPIDFTDKALDDAKKNLDSLYGALQIAEQNINEGNILELNESIKERSDIAFKSLVDALNDDLNTPKAFSEFYIMAKGIRSLHASKEMVDQYKEAAELLGLLSVDIEEWFKQEEISDGEIKKIDKLIENRSQAKKDKNWAEADKIRDELKSMGIEIKDTPQGTEWNKTS